MNAVRSTSLRRIAFASAALVAASTALTGCALDFIPDSAGEQQSQTAEPKRTETTAPQQAPAEDTTQSPEPGTDAAMDRDSYADAVERTVSCPGGALDVADIGSVIALDSDCTDITVSGSGTVLLASSIDRLTVVGVDNAVFVDQLGSLDVTGHGNVVTWQGGSPTVANTGINNELNPAR